MLKKLRALIILAGFCAACGGPVDDVAAKDSPLTSAQVYQAPSTAPGLVNGWAYSCGTQVYHGRQFVAQSYSDRLHLGSTQLMSDGGWSSDPSLNEMKILCPSNLMSDNGSGLCSSQAMTCNVYSHAAGQGWSWSVTAQITNACDLAYAPMGSAGHWEGYWAIILHLPDRQHLNQWGSGLGMNCFGVGSTPVIYAF